jgi:hypothetical protein
VTPTFDTKFNSARALSITGTILGGAAWFTLMLASCCNLNQARLNGLSCYFFLATLFQGLSLLIFRSNVCQAGFFAPYFTNPATGTTTVNVDFVESVSCGLSTGSKLAIAATVLWFVCNSMLPASVGFFKAYCCGLIFLLRVYFFCLVLPSNNNNPSLVVLIRLFPVPSGMVVCREEHPNKVVVAMWKKQRECGIYCTVSVKPETKSGGGKTWNRCRNEHCEKRCIICSTYGRCCSYNLGVQFKNPN